MIERKGQKMKTPFIYYCVHYVLILNKLNRRLMNRQLF